MELDDLRMTWKRIDQHLDQHNRIAWESIREKKLSKTQGTLKPLVWGQICQIVIGVVSIVFGVYTWSNNIDNLPILISGSIAHIYGIVLIATAGQIIHKVKALDYSLSVVSIQKQLLNLEKTYLNSGWLTGLPWWLLWLPFSLGMAAMLGVDLVAVSKGSGWVAWSLVVSTIGLALTVLWYLWAVNPRRGEKAEKIKAMLTSKSLFKAQQSLSDLKKFEYE